jgi:hypothetical protein
MGLASFVVGLIVAIASLIIGIGGSDGIERLWLYLLGSAMMMLVGVQLGIYWILLRVLEELSDRERLTKEDLGQA